MSFMDRFSLKGKKILITGGAQGIGKAVAGALAEFGAEIGILDLQKDLAWQTAKDIADQYGVKTIAYDCDVTKISEVEGTVASFAADFGTLDGVFNNAGICLQKAAEELTYDEWFRVVNVNFNGIFLVAQAAGKQMIQEGKRGSIVNTASMSGTIVNFPQRQASYNSSKAAVIQLTKSLAVEWAEYGIRVNCISPGYIWTEMTSVVDRETRNIWESLIPFKRMGTPEELVGGIIYLLSDASTYTSGCNLIMDGCYTCI